MIDNGLYVDKPKARSSGYTVFNLGAVAGTPVAPGSAKRVRLTFIGDGTNIIKLNTDGLFTSVHSLVLPTQRPYLELDIDLHGSLVQQPWTAFAAAGTPVLTVIETMAY